MCLITEKSLSKPIISFQFTRDALTVSIETERLLILSYQENDFENCVNLYGDRLITKYFDHGVPRSRTEVKELIFEKTHKYFTRKHPYGLFSIFLKEKMLFIGQIDLLPMECPKTLEVGFILRKEFHNQGFCLEAVKALIFDYVDEINNRLFDDDSSQVNKIVATVHPENFSSRKVLIKCGMSIEKFQERFGNPRLWYSLFLSPKTRGLLFYD